MEGQRRTIEPKPEVAFPEYLTPIESLPVEYRAQLARGCSTGWRSVDYYLQGIRPGEVTVITADTGVGKTTFCTQLILNCAMQGVRGWVNSWEMKPETTMRKLASNILRKPMKLCEFTEEDTKKLAEWGSTYKVHVNRSTSGTDIDALAKQLVTAKSVGVEVVMLDHLDYLVNFKREHVHEAIDEAVKRLHELAFSLSMHFLLICHPRQSATGLEEIGMHALKGSSSIKQYADNILILHRCARSDAKSTDNKVKVRVAKNRMFGSEGVAYLYYQPTWDGYAE